MTLVAEGIMCHAPIVIPSIGKEQSVLCAKTTTSMQAVAKNVVEKNPECLVIFSPHTPRVREGFVVYGGSYVVGDLSRFGYSHIKLNFENALQSVRSILPTDFHFSRELLSQPLDHGAFVPLWFLAQAGFKGQVCVIGFPARFLSIEDLVSWGEKFGASLHKAATRFAVIYSGDMSHALKPGAPCGFHPHGAFFDETLAAMVQSGKLEWPQSLTPEVCESACEDMHESLAIALGCERVRKGFWQLLSYEGPFGVGYLVAWKQDVLESKV